MPEKSYFIGFAPPTDEAKWAQARKDAADGKQILLRKVYEQIKNPSNLLTGGGYYDPHYGWLHRLGDVFLSAKKTFKESFKTDLSGHRASISLLGYYDFEHKGFEGPRVDYHDLSPAKFIKKLSNEKLPKKIVGIASMDDNWGWLSTHIPNRTCTFGFKLLEDVRKTSMTPNEQIKAILDDPNIVFILANQHHNVSDVGLNDVHSLIFYTCDILYARFF